MMCETSDKFLTATQAKHLQENLRKMRHDINNHLAVIVASAELIRYRPEMTPSMLDNLASKPTDIAKAVELFSAEVTKLLESAAEV